jgi:hypothetical protein
VVCQADVDIKASALRSVSSKVPLPLCLPLPRESSASLRPQQCPKPMPRRTAPPSKRPTSLLMFGKPSSRLSSSSSLSPKIDSSLDVTDCPVPVNSSVTFPAPPPSSLSKEGKVIDASSINHLDVTTSTGHSLVPLSVKQQASEVVIVASVVFVLQGNDICRLRCPATLSVFKEGKMIDIPSVNCQSLNPPCRDYYKGTQHLCDMPLDASNSEVAKAPSQPQPPPLLKAPIQTMPTRAVVVVSLELSQAQQSAEIVNSPCTVLDIQGNDTGHLRSSTASISKEGKKVVDVADINDRRFQPSGLRHNLSLPTSDTLAKLPPQLKPPLLEEPVPTMPSASVVPLSVEQQAAVLVAVHQDDNCHVKPSGTWKVQSLKEGKVSSIFLRSCRRHYRPRARHGHYRQRPYRQY